MYVKFGTNLGGFFSFFRKVAISKHQLHFLRFSAVDMRVCEIEERDYQLPSQAKVLTGSGDLPFASVSAPLSVSHSCV